jgi:hypothetical protein
MVSLLDVNLLIALAWPNHVHHEPALAWFQKNQRNGWATCPVTQSGFVRVSSNRRVMPQAKTPQEAILLLRRIVALEKHEFWTDKTSLASAEFVDVRKLLGHRQITDAHLLAVALENGGCLATFDAGIGELVPASHPKADAVHVIDATR